MEGYVSLVAPPVQIKCDDSEALCPVSNSMVAGGALNQASDSITPTTNNNNNGDSKFARCEGCGEPIFDRFVMRLSDSSWHEDCLFCSQCHSPLVNSCYYRDGKLFCRIDYERIFGVKCDRCGIVLSPHDLVMRTMAYIYHIHCFACVICGQPLQRGDQYVLRAGQLICRTDFEKELYMMQGFTSMEHARWMGDDLGYDDLGGGRPRDGRRGPKRPRTILTAAQRRQFKASFEISPKPCRKVREALAKDTGLSVRVVQVWFQNQRAKMKKMQRRAKTDKDGKQLDKDGNKDKEGGSESLGGVDADSYCDSEASLDDEAGSVYDNLEDAMSPGGPPTGSGGSAPGSGSGSGTGGGGSSSGDGAAAALLGMLGAGGGPPGSGGFLPHHHSHPHHQPPPVVGGPGHHSAVLGGSLGPHPHVSLSQQQQHNGLQSGPSVGMELPPTSHGQDESYRRGSDSSFLPPNPIDKLYLMQDSYFQH